MATSLRKAGRVYQFPFFPDALPRELLSGRVWVCCDREKVPLVPKVRGKIECATSTNPDTWRTFDEALAAYNAGRYCGIGRVFERGSGLVGVDIDGCRSPRTGVIDERGRAILDALDSYSEVSPSGTGVKVWVYADLPGSKVKPGLEVYNGGRYFTATGQILPQYRGLVCDRSDALQEIIEQEFPKKHRNIRPSRGFSDANSAYRGPQLDIEQVLERGGVEVLADVEDGNAEIKYRVVCPWVDEHTTNPESGTYCGQYPSGAAFFHCWHGHCSGRRYRDLYRFCLRPKRLSNYLNVEVSITYG